MSTMTAPGFMARTVSAVISLGAAAPGMSTEAMTRSARRHRVSMASRVENTVRTRAPSGPAPPRDPAEGFRVAVDHRHGRAHAGADERRMAAGDTAPDDHHVGGGNA